jgi:transposase
MSISVALEPAAGVVAVDVGKTTAAVLVTDAQRQRLLGPLEFAMTGPGVALVIKKTQAVLPLGLARVGVEAAGHYHRPLAWQNVWPGWQVVELNPAHVTEQRRVMGRRRVKTDAIDLEAITELLLAGRGVVVVEPPPAVTQLAAWTAHRHRRVLTPDRDKESVAVAAGPLLSGVDVGVARCARHPGGPPDCGAVQRSAPAGCVRVGPVRAVRGGP